MVCYQNTWISTVKGTLSEKYNTSVKDGGGAFSHPLKETDLIFHNHFY